MQKIVTLPGLVDPHVHFRTPGTEYKEDFETGAQAALAGGFSCVLDMPNTNPATVSKKELDWKIEKVQKLRDSYSSSEVGTKSRSTETIGSSPQGRTISFVNLGFHFGATESNLDEIKKVESEIASIKVFFGSSTGDLLVNNLEYLERLMRETTKIITVHAEDEEIVQKNTEKYKSREEPEIHSKIRSPEAAASAVKKLIELVRKTNHPVYFCHISTKEEVKLIKEAKSEGLPIFAEATPHHLFLDESAYKKWGNFVKVNPPLRSKNDRKALWGGINDGTIDTIGSDHAPHLPKEKKQKYWQAPSGIPGTETSLPLMLNAMNNGKLTMDKLVELMGINPAKIFGLDLKDCETTIDLGLVREVKISDLHSKCGWSPYEGMELTGWPVEVKFNNVVISTE